MPTFVNSVDFALLCCVVCCVLVEIRSCLGCLACLDWFVRLVIRWVVACLLLYCLVVKVVGWVFVVVQFVGIWLVFCFGVGGLWLH